MRGKKCIRFLGLTKEECHFPTLVVEVKGLVLGQDLKPSNNAICYVIFSQKKENAAAGGAEEDDDASTSVKVRQFILQKVSVLFVKELR